PSVREEDRWGPATFSPPVDVPLPAAGSGNLGLPAALFERLGGFDERLRVGEDIDLCWRAQLVGSRLLEVPEAVLHVRYRTRTSHAFRQAFAYAGSDRQIAAKYRLVIAAYGRAAGMGGDAPHADGPQPSWPRRAYRAVRKAAAEVARLRHPGGALLLSSELGEWLGLRLTRPDPTIEPVRPPAVLPPPQMAHERRGGQ